MIARLHLFAEGTMIDLYALHAEFPGVEEAEKLRNDPYQRVEALEKSWLDATGDDRFIPFIQLHEFEAYLFCDVSQFNRFFDLAAPRISDLQKIVDNVRSPELIDDGQHTVPSQRIVAEFPEYSKTTVGPQMAELIGLRKSDSNVLTSIRGLDGSRNSERHLRKGRDEG